MALAGLPAAGEALGVGVDFSFFGGFLGRLLFQQRLTVSHRNLIVVGMDFVEREEAVAIAAVVDECRLK